MSFAEQITQKTRFRKPLIEATIAALLILALTLIYVQTIYPGVGGRVNFGDSAKWQYLWAIGGTPHSTGYPLFLILTTITGNLLTFLEPSTRITALSVFFASGTLVLVYLISKLFLVNISTRLMPILILGTSTTFWSQATEAEVYTLNTFFIALVLFLTAKYSLTQNNKFLLAAIFIYSLSFGNHLTMIFLLPGLFYLALSTNPKNIFCKKILGYSLLFILIGFSQYFYVLYLSHAGSPELEYIGEKASISHWIKYITGGQFSSKIAGTSFKDAIETSLPNFLLEAKKNISIVGIFLFISTAYFIATQKLQKTNRSQLGIVFLISFSTYILHALSYDIPDIEVYYIPCYLFASFLIPYAIDLSRNTHIQHILIVAVFLGASLNIKSNYKSLKRHENIVEDEIRLIFDEIPSGSTIYNPMAGNGTYHGYGGHHAINYFRYVINPEKNISLTTSLPNSGPFFVMPPMQEVLHHSGEFHIESNATSLVQFLNNHSKHIVVLSAKNDAISGLSPETINSLERLGLNVSQLKFQGSFVAVINRGEVIFQKVNNFGSIYTKNKLLKEFGIDLLYSAGFKFGNGSSIVVNGRQYSKNSRGLNITVIKADNTILSISVDTNLNDRVVDLVAEASRK